MNIRGKLNVVIISVIVVLIVIGLLFFIKNESEDKGSSSDNQINVPSVQSEKQEIEESPQDTNSITKEYISTCKADDSCYRKTALKQKDPTICEEIKDSSTYDQCYSLIAVAINDSSLCIKIKKIDTRAICYTKIAEAKSDPELCKEISAEEFYKDQCYCVIAIKKLDPAPINYMTNLAAKNICYGRVADEKNDPSICNNIIDSSGMTKEDCIDGAS